MTCTDGSFSYLDSGGVLAEGDVLERGVEEALVRAGVVVATEEDVAELVGVDFAGDEPDVQADSTRPTSSAELAVEAIANRIRRPLP